jgi:cytochrome c-type biogenesis protein CcmH
MGAGLMGATLMGKALRCGRRWLPQTFRYGIVAAALLLTGLPVGAVEPSEQLKNPALEARARAISSGLRCLVCQNETIDESNATLAHDIRMLLRERLTAGDTDEQAVKAIVDRYGQFVLLDPPVEPATYVLWFGPAAILLAGLAGGLVWLRRRPAAAELPAPLSSDERHRLDTILQEADN